MRNKADKNEAAFSKPGGSCLNYNLSIILIIFHAIIFSFFCSFNNKTYVCIIMFRNHFFANDLANILKLECLEIVVNKRESISHTSVLLLLVFTIHHLIINPCASQHQPFTLLKIP